MNTAPEQGLAGLWRIAVDLGANTLGVLVLEAESCEIAYCRTLEGEVLGAPSWIPCGVEMRIALDSGPAPLPSGSASARFLTSTVAPASNSFFVFSSWIGRRRVAVLFGFADSLNLAALAAWSVEEVRRLRDELGKANRAFADRKLVERAKFTLQSERGMSEHQAYEYLRRMSRQRRIPISRFAQDLLAEDHVARALLPTFGLHQQTSVEMSLPATGINQWSTGPGTRPGQSAAFGPAGTSARATSTPRSIRNTG